MALPMAHRTVLVTGASSGLGRGLAAHYARQGATVHALARRTEALATLTSEVAARGGSGRVVPVALDVSDSGAQVAAIRAAEEQAGGAIDLVVANAGISEPTPGSHIDWRLVKQILDVNVSAACVTLAAALPSMVRRGSGTVVAISSLAAFRGFPGSGAYCASKAALHTFMESLRVDLRGTGVRAVCVYPGFVKTEMTAKNQFFMPFLMELDDAVRVMVRGIDRGDAVVAFPSAMSALARAVRAVPRAIYEPLAHGRGSGREA
jgi:short-subunit dehydrogenase